MSNLDMELYDAVSENKLAEVRILLGRGALVNCLWGYLGDTLLNEAATKGYVEIAELLIRNKADVNAPNNVGDTPLHKGINSYYNQGNKLVMVENLIRLGANVLVSNNEGATPLHSASKAGNVKVTDLLIRNKAGVNAPDNDGATPLHSAAKAGNAKVTDLLIRNKAGVNATDNDGATPLHSAAKGGNVDVTDLLIRNKAGVNAPDNDMTGKYFLSRSSEKFQHRSHMQIY